MLLDAYTVFLWLRDCLFVPGFFWGCGSVLLWLFGLLLLVFGGYLCADSAGLFVGFRSCSARYVGFRLLAAFL